MRIVIDNFQSIKHAEFEFSVGVNLILGATNSGKTAIFRAINSLLMNPSKAKKFIKKDTDVVSVVLSIDNEEYTWSRDIKETTYKINNQEHIKAGRSNLFDLSDKLPFVRDVNNDVINFSFENTPMFPLKYSDTEMFKLFEDIFSVSNSYKILQTMKEDDNKCNKNIINYNEQIKTNNIKIKSINKLLEDVDVNYVENIHKEYNELLCIYNELEKDLNLLKNIHILNEKLNPIMLDIVFFEMYFVFEDDFKLFYKYINDIKLNSSEIEEIKNKKFILEKRLEDIKTCPLCNQMMRC